MAIGKSFTKFKQMAGEKLGSSKKTEQSEEFKQLQRATELRRDLVDKMLGVSEVYIKTLTKKDGNDKVSIPESLGSTMKEAGRTLGADTPYSQSLIKVGEAQEGIGKAQVEYVIKLRQGFHGNLERSQADIKEYLSLKKKLHTRRLDFDSKMNKVQKAKRESPEMEEDMRAAQTRYEEVLADTEGKMTTILDSEELHLRDLASLVEAQLAFFRHSVEILEPLSASLAESGIKPGSPPPSMHGGDFRGSTLDRTGARSSQETTRPGASDISPYLTRSSTTTTSSSSASTSAPTTPQRSATATSSSPSPSPSFKSSSLRKAKALYPYEADGDDEISLVPDQIILIVEEIDEGWWIGETESGLRGMFPANYVEVMEDTPTPPTLPPPPPPPPAATQLAVPTTPPVRQPSYQPTSSSSPLAVPPPIRSITPTPQPSTSSGRQVPPMPSRPGGAAPPPRPTSRKPPVLSSTTTTTTASPPISSHLMGSAAAAAGAPPAAVNVVRAVPPSVTQRGMAAAVGAYSSSSTIASASSSVGPCGECGCDEFQPNVFKKESCNNCFHKH